MQICQKYDIKVVSCNNLLKDFLRLRKLIVQRSLSPIASPPQGKLHYKYKYFLFQPSRRDIHLNHSIKYLVVSFQFHDGTHVLSANCSSGALFIRWILFESRRAGTRPTNSISVSSSPTWILIERVPINTTTQRWIFYFPHVKETAAAAARRRGNLNTASIWRAPCRRCCPRSRRPWSVPPPHNYTGWSPRNNLLYQRISDLHFF